MKRNIKVEQIYQQSIEQQNIEIVERKGVGHPDSIADGLAESISRALCQEYYKRFGTILHHNTDETQIVAGRSRPAFGGGELINPIYILLVGRATKVFNGLEIPVDTIAIRAAKRYLQNNISNLDTEDHIILDSKIGSGSSDLCNIFGREVPSANDTSFGVGYAPLSDTEKVVYNTERLLIDLKKKIPAIGEDIKVMGMRKGKDLSLTVACAMVGKYLDDLNHYVETKEAIVGHIKDSASQFTSKRLHVDLNVGDDVERGSVYLTVTGTSAEMGDDGSVGRGNRANGLITPNRPMSIEATSGKNPVNHVGKIYNLLSTLMANDIARDVEGVDEVYIRILSQIGHPIDQPHVVSIQTVLKEGANMARVQSSAEEIANQWLDNIKFVPEKLARGELQTF
jgi:S-adenosylmethionine synthetase